MSVVPGKELMDMVANTRVGSTTAGDAYWAARAGLHRMGIAHNDMHPGNLLIDEKGKGRWVDMGLANDSPGAALAEALGVLRRPRGSVGVGRGDWQGQGYGPETGNRVGFVAPTAPENLRKMQSNHETKVLPFLRSKGLTDDEIGTVMTYGIRQDPSSYTTTSGFNKLNDSDALQAINLLYDGI
jgi:serine/threonine protein kinase